MKPLHCLAFGLILTVVVQPLSGQVAKTSDLRPDSELVDALSQEDANERRLAQEELLRRGDKNRAALLTLVRDIEKPLVARTAALTVMHGFWNDNVQLASTDVLRDSNPELRRLAADGLAVHGKPGDRDLHEMLVQHLTDEDVSVRRALYLAIGKLNAPSAADTILNALRFEESNDQALQEGLVQALELTGKNGVTQLLLLADSGEQDSLKKVVDVYPILQTRFAAEALPTLLRNYHLTPMQKTSLLHSYRNYRFTPPLALDGKMATAWLRESDSQVRIAAIQALQTTRTVAAKPNLLRLVEEAVNPEEKVAAALALALFAFGDHLDHIKHD